VKYSGCKSRYRLRLFLIVIRRRVLGDRARGAARVGRSVGGGGDGDEDFFMADLSRISILMEGPAIITSIQIQSDQTMDVADE
jgi:hypothetical protein